MEFVLFSGQVAAGAGAEGSEGAGIDPGLSEADRAVGHQHQAGWCERICRTPAVLFAGGADCLAAVAVGAPQL